MLFSIFSPLSSQRVGPCVDACFGVAGAQQLLQIWPRLPQVLGLIIRELHSLVSNSSQQPLLLLGDASTVA